MGIRKVSKTASEALDPRELLLATKEYLGLGKTIKDFTKRQGEVKKRLAGIVEQAGEEDDKGHIWLTLDEPVDGVVALKREKRVSTGFDEDKAVEVLAEVGILEECSKTIRVIDDELVLAAHYDGKLTAEQVDSMYPKKVSYAFVTARD